MGAYKYIEELHKKKQSDVMRFLLRVRCWEVSLSRTQALKIFSSMPQQHRLHCTSRWRGIVAHSMCLAIHSLNIS